MPTVAAGALLATRGGCPSTSRTCSRARRSRLDPSRRVAGGQPRPSGGRCRGHQRHRLLRRQPAGDHVGLRGLMYAQVDVPGCRRSPSGGFGGKSRTRPLPWPRSSPPQGRTTAGSASRASTTRSRPDSRPTRAIARLPFERPPTRTARRPGPLRRGRLPPLERRGARPTLDVNGIWGGFQGEGTKTIIPAHAHAKVSCRLVADKDPRRIFEARTYVEEIAPPGVRGRGQRRSAAGMPSLTSIDHPATQAAARALEETFGRAPSTSGRAARSRSCASFGTILGLPVVLLGFTPPDDHAHAPNEWMDLGQLRDGHPDGRPVLGRAGRPAAVRRRGRQALGLCVEMVRSAG